MHYILYHTALDVHDSRNYGNFEENIKVTMKFGNHITGWSYCNIKRWRIRIEEAFLISDNVRAHLLNEAQKK